MSPDELLNAVRRATLHLSLAHGELAIVDQELELEELDDIMGTIEEVSTAVRGLLEDVEDE